jgi:DNA-binding cell septation regulator SpoVG
MRVVEVRIWPVKGASSLKAKADLSLLTDEGEFSIKGFRVVEVPGKEAFVAPPQEKYQDKDGKSAYKDLLWVSRSIQALIYPKILESYNAKAGAPPDAWQAS